MFKQDSIKAEEKENGAQSDKERCRYSLVEFVKTYLSSTGDTLDDLCQFHYDIAHRLEEMVLTKDKSFDSCYMCARGHGKSFWVSYAFIIWCIAYKHTPNILLVTNESSLGRQFIIDIRQFIEDDEKFCNDFGNLVGNTIWTSEKLLCRNGICVTAKSSGSSLRGIKAHGCRPSAILCDDILSTENSGTPEQRQKLYDWFTKVLLKCGSKYCATFCIGTPQNDGDLLSLLFSSEQFSDYYTKKYPAIISYSDSPLWDTWINLRNDLSNPNRAEDADAFYFEHREEMLNGTEVLWDRYDDTYLVLMKERQKLGLQGWATEMMCEALDEETREFKEEWLTRNLYTPEDLPEITDVYIGVDAASTANRRSDESAIAVVGKGVDNYLYLLDLYVKKVNIDVLADQMVYYGLQYYDKIRSIRIEDVVFQILVKNIMEKRSMEAGLYLPFEGVKVKDFGKKEMKLRSLVIPVRNGYIKFRRDHRRLLDELRRFPKAKTDNCMDALWISTFGVIGGSKPGFCFTSLTLSHPKSPQSQLSVNSLLKSQRRW